MMFVTNLLVPYTVSVPMSVDAVAVDYYCGRGIKQDPVGSPARFVVERLLGI